MKRAFFIAVLSAVVIGLIGLVAVWAKLPLLFASLGPSVAIQTASPQRRSARAWNVAVGHLIALGVGVAALYASGAIHTPGFFDSHPLSLLRVAAAAFAIAIGILLEFLMKAWHPPAASTSLLVTLGIVELSPTGIGAVVAGVILVTVFGEAARIIRQRV
jgi:CBS-domain-containing membrane protein